MAKPTKVVEVETLEDVLEELAENAVEVEQVAEQSEEEDEEQRSTLLHFNSETGAFTKLTDIDDLYRHAEFVSDSLTSVDGEVDHLLPYIDAVSTDPREKEMFISMVVDNIVRDRDELTDDVMANQHHIRKLREHLQENDMELDHAYRQMGSMQDELDQQQLKIVVAFGIGATAAGTLGLLAYLRERKIRKSIITMIEEFSKDLLVFSHSDVHAITLETYCHRVTQLLLNQHVRTWTNPFGIKQKEARHIMELLNGLVGLVEDIKHQQLEVIPTNPEDIEAHVVTEPVEVEAVVETPKAETPKAETTLKKKTTRSKNTKSQAKQNPKETEK